MFYPTICILYYTDAYNTKHLRISVFNQIREYRFFNFFSMSSIRSNIFIVFSFQYNSNQYIYFCDPLSLQKSITLNIITCINLDNSSTNDLGDSFTHFTSCKIHLFKERDKTSSH